MTFRDLIGKKDITIYTVSRSGSFSKKTEMQMHRTSFDSGFGIYHVPIENLDSNNLIVNIFAMKARKIKLKKIIISGK